MDLAIYLIFVALSAIIVAGIYVERVVMYRTLRRFGVDPESRGWFYLGRRHWVAEYKRICDEYGLSSRLWKLLRFGDLISGVLCAIWLVLIVVASWDDIFQPMIFRLLKFGSK